MYTSMMMDLVEIANYLSPHAHDLLVIIIQGERMAPEEISNVRCELFCVTDLCTLC